MTHQDYIYARCKEDGDCWIWQKGRSGGGTPTMQPPGGGRQIGARRYLAIGLGLAVEGRVVTTTCRNKLCMAPEHLLVATPSKQGKLTHAHTGYASSIARCKKISDSKRARHSKLTLEQAIDIRQSSEILEVSAQRYGISKTTAHRIRTGEVWKDYSSPFAALVLR